MKGTEKMTDQVAAVFEEAIAKLEALHAETAKVKGDANRDARYCEFMLRKLVDAYTK